MKTNEINREIDVISLDNNNNIINNKTISIQEHQVNKKYIILANNAVKWRQPVFAPGYFNKKTNFIIGEEKSIVVIDENLKSVVKNTSDIKESDFIAYPVPCLNLPINEILEYENNNGEITDIHLTKSFGYKIGVYLSKGDSDATDITKLHPCQGFLKLFINTKNGLSLNKNIIINSNPNFIIGILQGYYHGNGDAAFFINNNTNIYTFATMMNYLGASYTIRNSRNNKKMFFQLPLCFKGLIEPMFIREQQYGVIENKIQLISSIFDDNSQSLINQINTSKILLVPKHSLIIEEIESDESDEKLYDLVSENFNATNYALPMTPILKNSDGDILAASGIFTKEALADTKVFSPEYKTYYRDLNSGEINNWIADDAIVGLYNSTKNI